MRKPDAVARPGPGAVTVVVPFCLMALVVVANVINDARVQQLTRASTRRPIVCVRPTCCAASRH